MGTGRILNFARALCISSSYSGFFAHAISLPTTLRLTTPLRAMNRLFTYSLLLCCLLTNHWVSAAQANLPFADGTRLVAIGDSITANGLYHSYVHLYHLTRFPERSMQMLNAGLSGDNASGTLRRYDWDIAPREANAATIMLGMNDVAGNGLYQEPEPSAAILAERIKRVDTYEKNMRALVEQLLKDGIRPILITPSIYDDTATIDTENQPGRNWTLGQCAERVYQLGREYDLPVIDFHKPMSELSLQLQAENPQLTLVGSDRVHPGAAGHLLMAYLYLKALDAPSDVARIEIDASTGKLAEAFRCEVTDLSSSDGVIHFNYLPEALPFPIDEPAREALQWVPLVEALNREMLTISDLPEGLYRLDIDGNTVGEFTAAALAQGVNLAMEDTPQKQQAQALLKIYKHAYRGPLTKLRRIAFVEHAAARNLEHPLTLEQVEPMLDQWVDSVKGRSYENYIRSSAERYKADKPQQAETIAAAKRALEHMHAATRLQTHHFVLSPLD